MFSYKYLLSTPYETEKEELKCYKDIAKAIDNLHRNNIVHSEVRFQNMIFVEGCTGKLIGFDQAEEVDVPYPNNYNHDFDERHRDAKIGEPRKKIHDKYSFWKILQWCWPSLSEIDFGDDGNLQDSQIFQSI